MRHYIKKDLGSTLGIIFGTLAIIVGITQPGGTLIVDIVMTIGALTYLAAKQRKLDEVFEKLHFSKIITAPIKKIPQALHAPQHQ